MQPEPNRPAPAAPRFWSAAMRVFDLSLGQMIWSRRTVFMALVVGAPIVLALVFRLSAGRIRVSGTAVDGASVFGFIVWLLYLRFIVPVLGVFYGTALIADEVEDKTLTYLFTRPVPRGAVLVGKYIAYLAATVLVVLPSVMLVYFLVIPFSSLATSFMALLTDLGLLAIGLAVYGAVFTFIGAKLKHPLVIGLIFAFGWEQIALVLPGYLRRFTVAYYLQALVPHTMPQQGLVTMLQSVFRDVPSATVSLFWLSLFLVVFLVLAARTVEHKEYVLEQ